MMWTYEATAAGYDAMWAKMAVRRQTASDNAARRIIGCRDRYVTVETATHVPWFWIGCIHLREADLSFDGVLHNGERIIGTGRKTTLVPAGRGPFATWEDSAIDALAMRSLQTINSWPVSRCLYEFEAYNGTGYVAHGENSPYVWAGTTLEQPGKYVSDGQYSAQTYDPQLGCAAVLSRLMVQSTEVNSRLVNPTVKPPPIVAPTVPQVPKPAQPAPKGGFLNAVRNFFIFSAKNQKDN